MVGMAELRHAGGAPVTVYLADPDVTIHHGDSLHVLRDLPDESVHMAVCSPPFFGLRDYGVDGQIGLEEAPDEWCARLVDVFREVRRVLRADGTLWVEVGDSYASTTIGRKDGGRDIGGRGGHHRFEGKYDEARSYVVPGMKAKDLVGAPWMLAFALRADGWVLRQEIIWSKPNPMPESVTDRCTTAHSRIFMFAKAKWNGGIEPWPMRDIDKAWLAAIVDGEGSICFQERERATEAPHIGPRLSIVNTNRALLDRVTEITSVGAGSTPSPRLRKDGNEGRPVFTWQVSNDKAARIIAAIRPYLVAKARQADLALYVHTLNQRHKGRGGHKTTWAELEAKRRAAAACSSLNRTGDADLAWFTPPTPGRWIAQPYHYDADAIREPHSPDGRTVTTVKQGDGSIQHRDGERWPGAGRNKRSVWSIPTQPLPFDHYAAFPEKLVEPCVLAGTSERGVCAVCGAPWARETIVEYGDGRSSDWAQRACAGAKTGGVGKNFRDSARKTTGWRPTCECGANVVPATILDPFLGSGTTALVARRLGRRCIGIELNQKYCELAAGRLAQQSLFAEEVA